MGYSLNDVYRPCGCGSGRKYKFCCLPKDREEDRKLAPERAIPSFLRQGRLFAANLEEGERLFAKGLAFVQRGLGREAIPFLERSIQQAPYIPQPHNNLALAYFLEGEVEKAIRVAEKVAGSIDPENTFALGSLVHFYLILGKRGEAERVLQRIARSDPRDEYAVFKKCEAFARVKRHEEVLEASSDPRGGELRPHLSYFRGTAFANLARYEEARHGFVEAQRDPIHGDRAKRFLRLIDLGQGPQTLYNDWPYFDAREWIPTRFLERLETDERARSYPGLVLALVAMLDDDPGKADVPIFMLKALATPEAKEVLRKVAFGTFGRDELRMKALLELQSLGDVEGGKEVKVWQGSQWRDVRALKVEVTDEAVSILPAGLEEVMEDLVEALRAEDWSRAERIGKGLAEKAPDCPSALHNLAIAVRRQGRPKQAEDLLRKSLEIDPSYLFAPAALVNILLEEKRDDEAREVLSEAVIPPRIHPQAYIAFLLATCRMALLDEEYAGATNALKMAKEIDRNSDSGHGLEIRNLEALVQQLSRVSGKRGENQRRRNRSRRIRLLVPEATLQECLEDYTRDQLSGMAAALGLPRFSQLKKDPLLRRIMDRLKEPEAVRRAVGALPEAAVAALREVLDAGGTMPFEEFTRRHGSDASDPLSWYWRSPQSTLGRLKVLGLLAEGTIGGCESVLIPGEIRGAIAVPLPGAHAGGSPAD